MEQTILRHDVLRLLDTGDPFDMIWITADQRRGTGGEIKTAYGWMKVMGDTPPELLPGELRYKDEWRNRNPNHRTHRTINVFNPANPGHHITKVHWRLIIFFNGKRVIQ